MSRIRIHHTAIARYRGAEGLVEAEVAHYEARLVPASGQGQFVLQSGLELDPAAPSQQYTDYWGTRVVAFDLHRPHREVRAIADALVDVAPRTRVPAAALDWDAVLAAVPSRVGLLEQAAPSELAVGDAELYDAVLRAKGRGATIFEAAGELAGAAPHAHAAVAALRRVGVPARTVAGYRHPLDLEPGVEAAGERQLWFEVWDGAWRGFDPALGDETGGGHVRIGRGRDAADLQALRGLVAGVDAIERVDEVVTVREA